MAGIPESIGNRQSAISNAPDAIILAAGVGKRMGDPTKPKVVYEVADRPLVWWVVRACRAAGVNRCIVVIGHHGEQVRQALAGEPNCFFVEQAQRLGTGHAARMAAQHFDGLPSRDVFVLAGDGPLIQAHTLTHMLQTHRQARAAATLATAVLENPDGYGRIVRDSKGNFITIVEQKDADDDQKCIKEVNPSYYCFDSAALFDGLSRITSDNAQGEYYLTDVPALLMAGGKTVAAVQAVPAEDALSINTPQQLAQVDQILRTRLAQQPQQQRKRA